MTIAVGALSGAVAACLVVGFALWLNGFGEPWIGFAGGVAGGLVGGILTLAAGYMAFHAAMVEVKANADEATARKALALRAVDKVLTTYIRHMNDVYEKHKDNVSSFDQSDLIYFQVDLSAMIAAIEGDSFWRVGDDIQIRLIDVVGAIGLIPRQVEDTRYHRHPVADVARTWKPIIDNLRQIKSLCDRELDEIGAKRRSRRPWQVFSGDILRQRRGRRKKMQ
ncbi:hypothetical protein [Azorhizobium doebereinerae]|uniref:hypothetical protein n=1 Tax=Azorhizobium doebereinerae TaxID=281091 RepID=UPI0012EB724E|nr:hypothetical protein [Azorhizobium doebereinerae]